VVAKWCGMRVERFSIFFGRPIAKFTKGETEYAIGWLPLGGYVKISGMTLGEQMPPEEAHRAYTAAPTWKKVATIAADYSFGYTNFMGFAADYCKAGGDIAQRFWQPLGQSDFAAIIAQLPDDVDAIYLGLGGTDAINFLNQYQQAGASVKLIGGTIMADQTVLTAKGKAKEALKGTPTSGPFAADNTDPAWTSYVKLYQTNIPEKDRFPSPSLFGLGYYVATQAAIKGLQAAGGDLSNGQAKFKEALSKMELDSPVGKITLNENRQATGTVFINEVVEGADGNLTSKMVGRADNVTQTLGMTADKFRALGLPSRDVVDCAKLRAGG